MIRLSDFWRTVAAPVAAVVAPVYLAGCFHYVPVDASLAPATGTDVRATLSSPVPFNLGALTVNDVRQLEGTVVETSPDSLGVWVKWLYPPVGEKVDANRAEFYVRRGNLAQLEEWRMSRRGTVVAVGVTAGVIAGMLALVSYAVGHTGGGSNGGGGPIQARLQVPIR